MKTPTSRTRDAFRRVTVITTVLAVAACGGGSDGTSSEAVTKSEGVQSFAGTVSCDSVGGTPQSRAFETRVILDRPVHRGMGAEVSGAAAVQVGGLAGSVVTDARSRIAATIPASSLFAGVAAPAIDFAVTASPATGTYTETGRWTVDVDANGKATLKGDSTAVLEPVANGWRAACRWNLAEAQAPSGPVSYGHIESRYGTPPTLPPVAKAGPASPVPKASDGGCGEKWGLVSDGIFVVAAIVAVPTGGAALAVVLTTDALVAGGASDAAGSACLDSQLAAMNQQSAAQAIQIQSIDNYLGTATNAVFAKFSQLEAQNAKTRETIFEEFVQTISPAGSAPGLYGSFLNTSNGLGLWTDALNAAPGAPTDPMQLAVIDTAYSNAILQVGPNSSRFANALRQLSGTDVIIPSGSTCSPDPSVCVVQLHDSALISLYQSMFEALQAKIDEMVPPAHTFGSQTNQGNIVPLYDQYNAMLVKYWTQAVYAMQQAFQMEWMVNQMNYFRATSTTATKLAPIGSWGALPGTHYKYGSQSLDVETKAYNTAQKNLAKAYAARINQLYLNTLNYVVSDVPVPPQAYPNTPVSYTFNGTLYRGKPVDYGQQVGKGIPATPPGVQGPRPLNVLPAYGVWQRSAVLYQFSGLKDVAACLTNLQAYTAGTLDGTVQDWLRSPDACPSILKATDGSAPNQGYYDGNTLSPYYSNLTFVYEPTTLVLTGKMVNNLKFCDPNNPASMYWYRPSGAAVSAGNPAGLVAGAIYLNCGSWYQPTFSASAACGFPRANCPANNNSLNGNLYDIEINRQWQGVPHDKWPDKRQSWNNSNYVLLTSLQGWSYTLGQGCSSAVVSSSMPQSPTLDGYARFEPGDYNLNSNAGCTLGIFADASWGSDFPPWDKARIEKFGIRLKNADGRNGFNVPVRITAGLFDCGVFCAAEVGAELSVLRQGSIQDDGFTCVQSDPNYLAPIRCTILDGSQYDLQLVRGEDPSSSKDFTLVLKMTLK